MRPGEPNEIRNLNQEKPKKDPALNLDSVRANDSEKYGFKMRVTMEIYAVSSYLVKGKAVDLLEGRNMTLYFKTIVEKRSTPPETLDV